MFCEMKAFLLVIVFGVSLSVVQSKAALKFDPLLYHSLFAKNAAAEKSSQKPCCHPETLEGSTYFSSSTPYRDIKFYLDYRNRKYAFEYLEGQDTVKAIMLCDSHRTCLFYNIVENKKNCTWYREANASIDNFWIRCIPNDATSMGAVRIGSDEKKSSLLLQSWVFMHYRNRIQRLVTDVDCIPVVDYININQSSNSSVKELVYYFDISKRIKDPSVFTPPSYCD